MVSQAHAGTAFKVNQRCGLYTFDQCLYVTNLLNLPAIQLPFPRHQLSRGCGLLAQAVYQHHSVSARCLCATCTVTPYFPPPKGAKSSCSSDEIWSMSVLSMQGFLAPGTDVTPIAPALQEIWQDSMGRSLADFNFRTVTSKFNDLVYQYPIRIPERYSLVIR